MDTRMTPEERQAFLAETRVGILSIPQSGHGPLTMPVWYSYQPGGELCIWTSKSTRKARLLLKCERVSFCVQEPTPPFYKYVSIEGQITTRAVDPEKDVHPMAVRYYGPVHGERYYSDVMAGNDWNNDIILCIQPERWLTADFSKAR